MKVRIGSPREEDHSIVYVTTGDDRPNSLTYDDVTDEHGQKLLPIAILIRECNGDRAGVAFAREEALTLAAALKVAAESY